MRERRLGPGADVTGSEHDVPGEVVVRGLGVLVGGPVPDVPRPNVSGLIGGRRLTQIAPASYRFPLPL